MHTASCGVLHGGCATWALGEDERFFPIMAHAGGRKARSYKQGKFQSDPLSFHDQSISLDAVLLASGLLLAVVGLSS